MYSVLIVLIVINQIILYLLSFRETIRESEPPDDMKDLVESHRQELIGKIPC